MPTGYTAKIKDMTFQDFALGCSKAFGALISTRDDDADTPIPDKFEPSDYHLKAIDEAKKNLTYYEELRPKEIVDLSKAAWCKAEESRLESLNDSKTLRAHFEAMIVEAESWAPPTEDHNGLKKFMLDQLKNSMKFDCSEEYYADPIKRFDPVEWVNKKREKAKRDIEYHTENYAEEVARCNDRSAWVQSLRNSL